MLLAPAMILIMFSKTSANEDKHFCFSSFCFAKDFCFHTVVAAPPSSHAHAAEARNEHQVFAEFPNEHRDAATWSVIHAVGAYSSDFKVSRGHAPHRRSGLSSFITITTTARVNN